MPIEQPSSYALRWSGSLIPVKALAVIGSERIALRKRTALMEFPVVAADQHSPESSMAEAKIDMRLSCLTQLFNSLDPSPFHERDLDQVRNTLSCSATAA
jgi:hypothetical protein